MCSLMTGYVTAEELLRKVVVRVSTFSFCTNHMTSDHTTGANESLYFYSVLLYGFVLLHNWLFIVAGLNTQPSQRKRIESIR